MALPQKILLINIFGLGDVLFTTPVMAQLKRHWPHVEIGYLCNKRAEDIMGRHPLVDQCFIYERDDFFAASKRSQGHYFAKMRGLIKAIREEHYDMVLDFSMNHLTSFLSWAAGIKDRRGLSYKKRGFFLNYKLAITGYERKHVVEYYLDLLATLDIPVQPEPLSLYIPPEDDDWAESFLRENGLSSKQKIVGLVPGGGASWGQEAIFKRWPAEKYAKLADNLIEKLSLPIILMGDKTEMGLGRDIAAVMKNKPVSALGQTTVSQFSALARKCSLVIVNDGGPLHMAVASGASTLSIFGPVDENVYGPYPFLGQVVLTKDIFCRPCYKKFRKAVCDHTSCLHQITVEDVFSAVEKHKNII